MLDVRTDYFLPLALRRVSNGPPEDRKETIELLILFTQLYSIPKNIRFEVTTKLTPQLNSEDYSLRYWAARGLAEYGCPEALPPLQEALAVEKNPSVRGWLQGAIAHLTKIKIESLSRNLHSKNPENRSYAAQALFFNKSYEARELISKKLNETDPTVLPWLLLAIPGPSHMLQRAALVWDPNPTLVTAELEKSSLIKNQKVLNYLISLLDSGDPQATEFSIWNFSLGREDKAFNRIIQLAHPSGHPNPRVREWAYKYLGFVSKSDSLTTLVSALHVEQDPEAREGIAFAIGQIGGPFSVEILTDILRSDKDEGVRKWTVRAMSNLKVSWGDAEKILINTLEVEKSHRIVREIYGALLVKGTPTLLTKLPLLEEHAQPDLHQTEVIELLISLASRKVSMEAKNRLLTLLDKAPTEPNELLEIAYNITEKYGLLYKIYSLHPQLSSLENYRFGLHKLFQAVTTSNIYLNELVDAITEAHTVFVSFSSAFVSSDESPGLFPQISYANFYAGLCDSFLKIARGFEYRFENKLDLSAKSFSKASSFFRLHSKDTALNLSEKNLCTTFVIWLNLQIKLNRLAGMTIKDYSRYIEVHRLIDAAIYRAKDSLRSSLVDHMIRIKNEIFPIDQYSDLSIIFDRNSMVNKVQLAIPVASEAPFYANECVSIKAVSSKTVPRGLAIDFEVEVNNMLMKQLKIPFDIFITYSTPFGEQHVQNLLFTASEISGSARKYNKEITINPFLANVTKNIIILNPLLKFEDFEWIIGKPVQVVVEDEVSKHLNLSGSSVELRKLIDASIDLEELRNLCQDLKVDFDNLRGETKVAKIRELINYMRRHRRIYELLTRIDQIIEE